MHYGINDAKIKQICKITDMNTHMSNEVIAKVKPLMLRKNVCM